MLAEFSSQTEMPFARQLFTHTVGTRVRLLCFLLSVEKQNKKAGENLNE